MTLATTLALAVLTAAEGSPKEEPPTNTSADKTAKVDGGGGPAASVPEAIRKAFGRELPPLPRAGFEIARKSGTLRGEVEANGKIAVGREGDVDTIAIPLGTEQGIHCYVSGVRMAGASPFAKMLSAVKQSTQVVSVRPVEVASVAGSPALFLEIVYLADAKGKKVAGQFKQAVVVHPNRSLMCFHDEPGYAETFRRVVKGLGTALAAAGSDARASAKFVEILAVTIQGQAVGFLERAVEPGERGTAKVVSFSSMVIPRSPSDVMTNDVTGVDELDASGRIVSAVHSETVSGEVDAEMKLERGADGKAYAYQGTVKGKKVAGTFATRDGLVNDVFVATRMPEILSGVTKEERLQEYAVSANPVAPVETVYRKGPGAQEIASEVGGIKVRETVDGKGWPSRLEAPLGALSMTYERIWSRGAP